MKSQILKLAKNSLIYGLGTMIQRFIALLLLPLLTAYLTPTDFGVLALLALAGQVAQPVFGLGLAAGMGPCYFHKNNEARKAACVWTSFILLLLSASVLIAIAWLFSQQLSTLILRSSTGGKLVALSLTAVAINNLATPFVLRLQFENRAIPFIVLSAVSTAITILLSVTTVIFLGWGVKGVVFDQLVGYAAGTLLFGVYARGWTRFAVSAELVRELLSLGLPLVPAFASLLVIIHGNKYILQILSGLSAVGIYSIGFNFGMAMSIVVGAFQTAWYSYFMSFLDRQEEAKTLFGRILTYYLLGGGCLVLLMFVAARPVVRLMTQPAFYDAYKVVGLVACAQFLTGVFSLLLPALYFARRVVYVTIVQFVAAIALVVWSFLLIPPLGSFGAALALVLATLMMVLLLGLMIERNQAIYLRILYERDRIVAFSVVFLVIGGFLLLPYRFVWWQQAIILPIATLVVVAAMGGLLHRSERRVVLQIAGQTKQFLVGRHRNEQ